MKDAFKNICANWVDVPFWFATLVWTFLFSWPGLVILAITHLYWSGMLIVGILVAALGIGSAAFSRHLHTKYCR